MDVFIHDFKMPEDCDSCPFYNDNYDYPTCILSGTSRGYNWNAIGQRMDDCKLSDGNPQWTSVRDGLPEVAGFYQVAFTIPMVENELGNLFTDDDGEPWNLNYVTMAYFNKNQGGIWQIDNSSYGTDLDKIDTSNYDYISHWAPMMELPDELKPKRKEK